MNTGLPEETDEAASRRSPMRQNDEARDKKGMMFAKKKS